ncbi:CCCH zinc finger protein [Cryptococcus neoformans c45]|nr:CCCH zinc finger protein [Cryptococcus neoformans var. grubii c45]
MSDAEKKRIQLEIARLSGAIHRHTHNAAYHPYKSAYPPVRGHSRGRGRGAASTRGHGRGGRGAYSLDLRAQNQAVSAPGSQASTPTGAGSTTQAGPSTEKEEGEIEPEAPVQSAASWVNTARSGHRSLMTAEKRAQLQANSVYKTSKSSASLKPPGKGRQPRLKVKAVPVPDGTPRVFIDGVTYEFNSGGKGLKRTSEYKQPNTLQWYIDSPKPRLVSVLGIKYRFQPNGDLTLPKSNVPRKGQLCPYFSKTGRCRKGHICKAIHDPDRVAACPNFLRGRCELGPICPLSHNPTAHNTPSCTRFQALSYCTRPNCPYPHVKVSNDAPICEDFAFTGWCDTAEGECPNLHSYDCPEFWSTGKCPRGAKCKLRHTLRAEKGRVAKTETTKEEEKKSKKTEAPPGSFEEQTEFIVFDDEGSPGLALSESEEDDEEENDDDDEDEDEDEDEEDEDEDGHGKQEASADEKDESDEDVKILF